MLDILQRVKRNVNVLTRLLPILSFIPPLFILYSLYAWSFEKTFQGRTFLLFFSWLVVLEIILCWEKLQKNKVNRLKSMRTALLIIVLLLPTIYVIVANYCGLNAIIEDLAKQNISPNDPLKDVHASSIPVSTEYMVFSVFLGLIVLLAYGIGGLTDFSISTFFAGTIGILFTIDNLYPFGKFTPLQILVPTTARLAANVFNLMGYTTSMIFILNDPIQGSYPRLSVTSPQGESIGFGIAWPCSGIESLLIYTVTILIFLKKTDISWKHRIIYFSAGAVVTFFINVFRIITLFLLAIDYGWPSPEAQNFHDYYGMLYSITWIISYPLIIIGSRTLWKRIRNWKTDQKKHRFSDLNQAS
ncbi:MAG: exosortase/archaeosortase family protein [Candidatus Bathyarchaeota archaeon]|nr:exosortase/archaeosortase family protein [Candidatus Bathyarchaeota archaeon]